MAALLDDIPWDEPLLPCVSDAAWEKQMEGQGPPLAPIDPVQAPLPCLRQWAYAFPHGSFSGWDAQHKSMIALVVSQENSCWRCYGLNRAVLMILGYSEAFITAIERDLRIAELEHRQRALFALCRNLARSRPSRRMRCPGADGVFPADGCRRRLPACRPVQVQPRLHVDMSPVAAGARAGEPGVVRLAMMQE